MNVKEFKKIISSKNEQELPGLMAAARQETLKYFGRVVQLYTPLYLSNECVNDCVYCGFHRQAGIKRVTLSSVQVLKEARSLKKKGFQHILLLTGEAPAAVPLDYLEEIAAKMKELFVSVAIEIYPLEEKGYRRLVKAGVDGLTIYQETYHKATYKKVHPRGPKSDFSWRDQAPARAARAGLRKIGVGFLLGLYDWRYEALKLAEHLNLLLKEHWQTQFQLSFPRLNPAETGYQTGYPVSDKEFIRLFCAFRLLFPQIGFVISTRERPEFRDKLLRFGVTQMSAGSKTSPGGYTLGLKSGQQFEIADHRSPQKITEVLLKAGYDPVWKDWERTLT